MLRAMDFGHLLLLAVSLTSLWIGAPTSAAAASSDLSLGVQVARGSAVNLSQKLLELPGFGDRQSGPCVARAARTGLYQLVGKVVPEVFGCGYGSNAAAQYLHSGSPLLDADAVKLSIFRPSQNDMININVHIYVSIIDSPAPIVSEGEQRVVVNEFLGRSPPLVPSNLHFHINTSSSKCIAKFSRSTSQWPIVGQLLLQNSDGTYEAATSFEMPCQNLTDNVSIVYEHLAPPSPDVDYVPLEVQAVGSSGGEPAVRTISTAGIRTHRFHLPVYVYGGLPNQAPKASFLGAYVMDVDEFTLSTIIPGVLSATDAETPAGQLIFNITRPPTEGHFVHLSDHTESISSFRQEEMDEGMIAYWPPDKSYVTKKIYQVEFRVHDFHFAWSSPIVLHIAVRPSATRAPRVAVNAALTVLEGHARLLDQQHLRVVDNDDGDSVRMHVVGGLEHGNLLLDGQLASSFTQRDVTVGRVRYVHDDSNSARDHVDLRVTDGKHVISTRFFFNVLPKDDTPPFLVRNVEAELREGETVRISAALLFATDEDSNTEKIRYIVSRPPRGGELLKKISPKEGGTVARSFTNRDILRGYMYYKHLGGDVMDDSFEFTLTDGDIALPNESPGLVFTFRIHAVDDTPPVEVPGTNRSASVLETDLLVFSLDTLHYTDGGETSDDDILYTVASPPRFTDSGTRSDAGRIVSIVGLPTAEKNSSLPSVQSFHQRSVKHGFIAYLPPAADIGYQPRTVHFTLTASDQSGNTAPPSEVKLTVLPVDNVAPRVAQKRPLKVLEGGSVLILMNDIDIRDEDTSLTDLRLTLEEPPSLGHLTVSGNTLDGGRFSLLDVEAGNVRYIHDGDDSSSVDRFILGVSDGSQSTVLACDVHITLVNDKLPFFLPGLMADLLVHEGTSVVLTEANLAAADRDTDNDTLSFIVRNPGLHGSLYLDNIAPVLQFTQENLKSGRVSYRTLLREVGPRIINDSMTLSVTDRPLDMWPNTGSTSTPTFQLRFKVMPVNNQRPSIRMKAAHVEVQEGARTQLTTSLFAIDDADTDVTDLWFLLLKQPSWGFIESHGHASGSELTLTGRPLAVFSYRDLSTGLIHYVQSNHTGIEPTQDSCTLHVSDGVHNSSAATLRLRILGVNDEKPRIHASNLTVLEGHRVLVENVTVSDLDVPRDLMRMSVRELPRHGLLTLTMRVTDPIGRATTHELPMKSAFDPFELGYAMQLAYTHDGSEKFADYFVLQVTDGMHAVEQRIDILIRPQNDAAPTMVRNTGALLYYNETVIISRLMLFAHDEDSSDDSIFYNLVRMPTRGYLELFDKKSSNGNWRRLRIGNAISQEDVNMNRFRYTNFHISTEDKTADVFEFQLSDGVNARIFEAFEIEVRKSRVLPRINVTAESPLRVRYGERAVVTTTELNAYDSSDMHTGLVYTVGHPPRHGRLDHIVHIEAQPGGLVKTAATFTQVDVAAGRIIYVHCGCGNATMDSVDFSVLSSSLSGLATTGVTMSVTISPSDVKHPVVKVKEPATVNADGLLSLADVLDVFDPDTDEQNVTITLVTLPRHGKISIGEHTVHSFTLDDLKRRRPVYSIALSSGGTERLGFRVSDGSNDGHIYNGNIQQQTVLNIGIGDVVERRSSSFCSDVKLVPLRTMELIGSGRQGFAIRPVNVRLPGLCNVSSVVYRISVAPLFGTLTTSNRTKLHRGANFTHHDLVQGIFYVMNNVAGAVWNDTIGLSLVADGQVQTKVFSLPVLWHTVEFDKPEAVVCESSNELVIKVRRRGEGSGASFVTIVADELTAKANVDFVLSKHQQLQFEGEMTELTYTVAIVADDLSEGAEKFRLSLTLPVNAILGVTTHMMITIDDTSIGECQAVRHSTSTRPTTILSATAQPVDGVDLSRVYARAGQNYPTGSSGIDARRITVPRGAKGRADNILKT